MRCAVGTSRGSAENTPGTSVYSSQESAPSAWASATAVVSEPPRPRKVTFRSLGDALGAPHHRGVAVAERVLEPFGPQLDDLGVGVRGVGDEAGLAPGEAVGGHAEVVERHAQQGRGLAFAGRQQHVHLPARADLGHVGGEPDELVGLLAHRAHDDDDVVTAALGASYVVGDLTDPLRVGDRRAAELLYDQGHGRGRYRRLPSAHELVGPLPSTSAPHWCSRSRVAASSVRSREQIARRSSRRTERTRPL